MDNKIELKEKRLGEERKNTFGTLMKIIEYNNADDIWVEFQDKYKTRVHTQYGHFKRGGVKNPYDKIVCGVGYHGQGKYTTKGKDGKTTKAYETWRGMIRRCYDPYKLNKNPTYIDCYVCEEWHNFQNFAEWYYKNYYEIEGQRTELDKDILCKGNKIYSPETCVLVPQRINSLFIKRTNDRGKECIGVFYETDRNKYKSTCSILVENKQKQLIERFDTELEAFYWYKEQKEKEIKRRANEYKNLIPKKLYDAMCNYKVEIND